MIEHAGVVRHLLGDIGQRPGLDDLPGLQQLGVRISGQREVKAEVLGNPLHVDFTDGQPAAGRGAVEYVLLGSDTQEVVERFYNRVRNPYLTDISIDWGNLVVDGLLPDRIPDLFTGQTLVINGESFETSALGIFSAGDCVTGPDVLVRAAGNGKRAADRIDRYLRGEPVVPPDEDRLEDLMATIEVYDKDEDVGLAGGQEGKHLEMLDPEERRHTFAEVEVGFPIPVAREEAERCLRCYRIGLVVLGPKA